MKLIHIADTHLGLAAFSRLDPASGMNLREKQIYDNFLAAIDVIIKQKPDALVTHGLASQIKDKRLATVAEHELDGTILADTFDYIALGHYHIQSQVTDNAWYAGSTEFLTYGEIHDTKGGLVVDTAKPRDVQHLDLPKTLMADCGTNSAWAST